MKNNNQCSKFNMAIHHFSKTCLTNQNRSPDSFSTRNTDSGIRFSLYLYLFRWYNLNRKFSSIVKKRK